MLERASHNRQSLQSEEPSVVEGPTEFVDNVRGPTILVCVLLAVFCCFTMALITASVFHFRGIQLDRFSQAVLIAVFGVLGNTLGKLVRPARD